MTTELLSPPNTIARIREIEKQGGKIYRMEMGDTNSSWVIQWAMEKAPPPEPQQEMSFDQT